MSAYGAIPAREGAALPSTLWALRKPTADGKTHVTVHHLTLKTARELPGLPEYLCKVFGDELERGLTYPQEGPITQAAFEAYFFAADVFVAVLQGEEPASASNESGSAVDLDVAKAAAGRKWEDCLVGYYYVKPNYPGRSSHICNAGFVVPPQHRGGGFGVVLADTYLHYAPKLGYQASVFNLVYVNNVASIRLWERLGFTKAGRIPRAGRLKRADGNGEEYVDAWVFYKSFIEDGSAPEGS
ncbi:acyl-CoA N-acyltransferase, partial [Schizophyllum commune]